MKAVYKITNTLNNKIYIGSSKRVEKRLIQHKTNLKCNRSESKLMQEDCNLYGYEVFKFEIIEYTDDLKAREQFYIDTLKPEYNVYKTAYSPKGYKLPYETKLKISESNRKAKSKSKFSEEQILQMIDFYKSGVKQTDIANMFGTNQGYVSHIVNKKVRQYIG